jgi:hypothetical protein
VSKAYLEPNVINWSRRSGWSGAELRRRLVARALEPHFGIHGIYELARGLLSERHQADAQRNFEILSELLPVFGPTPEMLFGKELDRLRTGATVIPILDELNRASAKQQVVQMAAGRLEEDGREFVRRRQAGIQRDYPHYIANQRSQIRSAVASGARRPTTFEEAFAGFDSQVPGIIRQLLGNRVTASEAVELHARLDEFPALRSTVRANLSMWAVPLVSGVEPSTDKNDDYRHVIEASYADVFVTGDNQLARTVPRLHPGLSVLTWLEFAAG